MSVKKESEGLTTDDINAKMQKYIKDHQVYF